MARFISATVLNLGVFIVLINTAFFVSCNTLAGSLDSQISRTLFTSKLKNNEPLDEVLVLENDIQTLYFFSEVKNMHGKTITHRWEYRADEKYIKVFERKFKVSKKTEKLVSKFKLDSTKTGEWMVIISDEQGRPVKAAMFKYVKKGNFAGKGILPIKPKP